MPYEITPEDFRNIVQNPKCSGTETENGKAKDGHSSCSHCKGNYFVGGECNYGGKHKMSEDLKAINKNFKAFDSLVSQQVKLSKSKNKNEFEQSKKTLLSSFERLKKKCEDEGTPTENTSTPKQKIPLRTELAQKQQTAWAEAAKQFPCNFFKAPEEPLTTEQREQWNKHWECYWNQFTTEERKEIEENQRKNAPPPSKSFFFYGSCIGLDGTQTKFAEQIKYTFQRLARELAYYMDQVQKATWEQLHAFQEKLKKIDRLSSEATKLAEEWKNETDPVKKAQLLVLLNAKKEQVASLKRDLENDPVYSLFSKEKSEELENIVKNIFQGKANFFNWKKKGEIETEKEADEKYFGVLPKEPTKLVLYVGGLIIIGVVIWKVAKSKFK